MDPTSKAAGLAIAPASSDELDLVIDVLGGAASWMRERGLDRGLPGQWPRGWLAQRIAHGETFLARRDGVVVGTISLEWSDEAFWPDAPADAGYIHRLVLTSDGHGSGVGRAMIEWAEREIVAAGRPFARLDCVAESTGLRTYYEALGFVCRGERTITQSRGKFRAALYEKALRSP